MGAGQVLVGIEPGRSTWQWLMFYGEHRQRWNNDQLNEQHHSSAETCLLYLKNIVSISPYACTPHLIEIHLYDGDAMPQTFLAAQTPAGAQL